MSVRPHFLSLWCALCLAVGISACRGSSSGAGGTAASGADAPATGTTTAGSTTNPDGTPTIVTAGATAGSAGFLGGNGNNYRLIGRFDMTNPNAIRLSHLGAKIGATFSGNSLSVVLGDTSYNMFNISIDGVPQTPLATSPNSTPKTYSIASGLQNGNHTVWMTKRTEPYQADKINVGEVTGTTTFYNFVLASDGAFGAPPAGKTRLIEMLGDSSCTGYGVDQLVASGGNTCLYSIATQNADASVPAFAAAAADAEIVNLSASGRGIYTSQYDPNDLTNQLPYLYKEAVPPAASSVYGFNQYQPDVVVINGGGDDVFGDAGSGAFPDAAAFVAAYTDLLTFMRGHYPSAYIVCAVGSGTFGSDKTLLTNTINQVVAARTAAGDANVAFYDYFAGSPNGWTTYGDAGMTLGYGCEGHSSTAGSKFLGNQLGTFIKGKMGW